MTLIETIRQKIDAASQLQVKNASEIINILKATIDPCFYEFIVVKENDISIEVPDCTRITATMPFAEYEPQDMMLLFRVNVFDLICPKGVWVVRDYYTQAPTFDLAIAKASEMHGKKKGLFEECQERNENVSPALFTFATETRHSVLATAYHHALFGDNEKSKVLVEIAKLMEIGENGHNHLRQASY